MSRSVWSLVFLAGPLQVVVVSAWSFVFLAGPLQVVVVLPCLGVSLVLDGLNQLVLLSNFFLFLAASPSEDGL